jgi:DNA-binding response OmpR family regulator
MPKILVVEDEPSLALALRDDLRREGYDVIVVGDGESAVIEAGKGVDLILLDVMLPKKDGFDVCRDVRLSGITVPIVMLTARTQDTEKVLAFETGADDYVTKPYSPRELRARVKAHLRRADGVKPEVVQFGENTLDLVRCELRQRDRVVDLSPLEYKLLAAFVRRAGRVLSRTQILEEVWGTTHVTDRVVDNQLTHLRRKIEPDPERPRFIVSLRGLGYRFDVDA